MPIKKQLSIENISNHLPLPTRKPTENTKIYLLTATGKQQKCITGKLLIHEKKMFILYGLSLAQLLILLKLTNPSKIKQLTHQGITYTNDKDIANTLNNYFSNIGKTLTGKSDIW